MVWREGERDLQAHPIFTDEDLEVIHYALIEYQSRRPGLVPEERLSKIMDARLYREKKDGRTQAEHTAAQRAARAEAPIAEEAQEGR